MKFGGRNALLSCFLLSFAANTATAAGRNDRSIEPPATSASGYLPAEALPNSLALLPRPPAPSSIAFALDQDYSQRSLGLRDTPAWTPATSDGDLQFPHAAGTFSCALNVPITQADTPHLYTLLRRTLTDVRRSTTAAKDYYARPRPFVVNKAPTCMPRQQLGGDGSYPSAHSAVGTAWALILTEISPQQTEAILARGRSYALSRLVCNEHWYSDSVQGRFLGAYVAARLNAEPAFLSDLQAARVELETARAKGLKAMDDCKAERAALDLQRSLEP